MDTQRHGAVSTTHHKLRVRGARVDNNGVVVGLGAALLVCRPRNAGDHGAAGQKEDKGDCSQGARRERHGGRGLKVRVCAAMGEAGRRWLRAARGQGGKSAGGGKERVW